MLSRIYSFYIKIIRKFTPFVEFFYPNYYYRSSDNIFLRNYHIILPILIAILLLFLCYALWYNHVLLLHVLIIRRGVLVFNGQYAYIKFTCFVVIILLLLLVASVCALWLLETGRYNTAMCKDLLRLLLLVILIVLMCYGAYMYYAYVYYIQLYFIQLTDTFGIPALSISTLGAHVLLLIKPRCSNKILNTVIVIIRVLALFILLNLTLSYIINPLFNWYLISQFKVLYINEVHACLLLNYLYAFFQVAIRCKSTRARFYSLCTLTMITACGLGARVGFKVSNAWVHLIFTDFFALILSFFVLSILIFYIYMFLRLIIELTTDSGHSLTNLNLCFLLIYISLIFIFIGLLCTMICLYTHAGIALPMHTLHL